MKYIIVAIVIVAIAFVALLFYPTPSTPKGRLASKPHFSKKCLLAVFGLVVIAFGCFASVPANSVGIVYDELNGGIQKTTLGEGIKIKSPFQKVTVISTTNKSQTIEVSGQTKDAIYADFMITITYRISKEDASTFYKATNSDDISAVLLNSIAKEKLQSVSTKYEIYDILGENLETVRIAFLTEIESSMKERYGITVVSTSFDDIDAGERIEEIVRQKGEALQQIEIEKLAQEKALIEKERLMIEAEAQAEVVRIQAEAEAGRVEISAEAEANRIMQEKEAILNIIQKFTTELTTLTEQEVASIVLQTIFIEKWDGVLPEVLTSESLSALIGALIQSGTSTPEEPVNP